MKVVRRTNYPKFTDYRRYKQHVREDFQYCCAYCRLHESAYGLRRSMSIDHFRPKAQFKDLIADYGNLYYCCGPCNDRKYNHWPDAKQRKRGMRFVDVCRDEWDDHLEVINDVIAAKTKAGQYTFEKLKFDRPGLVRRIRDLRIAMEEAAGGLRRIDQIRQRDGKILAADSLRNLSEQEAVFRDQLEALRNPAPLVE
ncbi:MAG TPA: HNH endonuclease [Humisphaera sp.]|nr:HNH endonuclease [Humisphaera sp.]